MNREWSLDVIYQGYDDPKFQKDYQELEQLAARAKSEMEAAAGKPAKEGLESAILLLEKIESLAADLGTYVSLRNSTDTADGETNDRMAQLDRIFAGLTVSNVMFQKYVGSIPELEDVIAASPLLTDYAFMLRRIRQKSAHLMSDELEDLAAQMNLTGGSAWAKLFDFLTSGLKVDYDGEMITLPAVRNLAYSEDAGVRSAAYQAELASYDKIADSIAFALNNIKSQVTMLSAKRGYASPLAMTLEQCGMQRETLDAMLTAMKEYLPRFWEYLRAKSHYLGHESGLPWYDLFAPVGTIKETFTAETAKEALVSSFAGFSAELADMIRRAFDESWIDFDPHAGKVGGAFCAAVANAKQSRILTNFNGSFDAVVTLAHELGHAFHNQQIFENRILNQDYSMPVAETASTFNETYFMLSAYQKSTDKGERLAILESLLQGTTQIICDIYSRYLFEDEVFGRCQEKFLMAEDLKQIMLDAQKKAYGDGLDPDCLHPYMWACKGHYYSSGLSYYNFPYAFGGLLAMGLYTQYQKEGDSYIDKYKALLKATSTSTVEGTAMMADIDLTTPEFWRSSLKSFAGLIDEYVELAKALRS